MYKWDDIQNERQNERKRSKKKNEQKIKSEWRGGNRNGVEIKSSK